MKRRYVHTGFALLSVGLLAIAGSQYLKIHAVHASQRAVDNIQATDDKPRDPRAQLAWANKLLETDQFERAEKAYNELINDQDNNDTGQAAQFNLANSYLRQGMHPDSLAEQRLPMFELAKQRYRDLLETNPDHWNARYNLERTLRLAPENDSFARNDKGKPVKRVNVVVPDFKIRDLP